MLSKSNWRGVMGGVILCTGLLFGLSSFVSADDKSKPDCVLCGHITDSTTGQAVTDAIINIYGEPISKVEADANGFYCFEKISEQGNYRIGIDSNEYVGIYNYDEMPVVNLKSDNQVVKDFKLSRACMIKVQVVDEANQPIENAEISVNYLADERTKRIGSDMLRRKTDKEGFYLDRRYSAKDKLSDYRYSRYKYYVTTKGRTWSRPNTVGLCSRPLRGKR